MEEARWKLPLAAIPILQPRCEHGCCRPSAARRPASYSPQENGCSRHRCAKRCLQKVASNRYVAATIEPLQMLLARCDIHDPHCPGGLPLHTVARVRARLAI